MNNAGLRLALASTLVIAVPFSAQGSPSPNQTRAKSTDPMSEIICQKQEVVGSRLATRRVCMTSPAVAGTTHDGSSGHRESANSSG